MANHTGADRSTLLKEGNEIFAEHESRTPRYDIFTSEMKQKWLDKVFSLDDHLDVGIGKAGESLYIDDLLLIIGRDVELAKVYIASSITLMNETATKKRLPDEAANAIQRTLFIKIATAESIAGLSDLAIEAARQYHDLYRTSQFQSYSYPVCQAIEIILRNRHNKISLAQIADQLKMNPSYLSRRFHQETGQTVSAYITQTKMEEADYMINAHLYTMDEIAGLLSYEKSYFMKLRRQYLTSQKAYPAR